MPQQDLADLVGVTRQTIVALEGGAYTPSLALALRIAKVFRKPTEQVFWLDGE
jgi:putative transcriptional regulator